MSNSHDEQLRSDLYDEIHEIMLARFEGTISNEQVERLEQLVINDELAREIYIAYMCETTVIFRAYADFENMPVNLEKLKESILSITMGVEPGHRINGRGEEDYIPPGGVIGRSIQQGVNAAPRE